jgi:hypothetical protein
MVGFALRPVLILYLVAEFGTDATASVMLPGLALGAAVFVLLPQWEPRPRNARCTTSVCGRRSSKRSAGSSDDDAGRDSALEENRCSDPLDTPIGESESNARLALALSASLH